MGERLVLAHRPLSYARGLVVLDQKRWRASWLQLPDQRSVIVAIASLPRRGRLSRRAASNDIDLLRRRASEAAADLADPHPLFPPAQDGAQGLQLGVVEEEISALRSRYRPDNALAQEVIHVCPR